MYKSLMVITALLFNTFFFYYGREVFAFHEFVSFVWPECIKVILSYEGVTCIMRIIL